MATAATAAPSVNVGRTRIRTGHGCSLVETRRRKVLGVVDEATEIFDAGYSRFVQCGAKAFPIILHPFSLPGQWGQIT
jgi:hypothetical protein